MAALHANTELENLEPQHELQLRGASELWVELVDSSDRFAELQQPWKALYTKDRESGFYLSWEWIAALFQDYAPQVRILAVRAHDGAYRAFFPISTRTRWSRSTQKFQTVLEPAGRAALSELTGILCDPNHEAAVVPALARAIAALPWTRFSMRYEPTGRRSKLLLDALPAERFKGRFRAYLINEDTVDNLNCPQVRLPADHDQWLAGLSANTRQKIRRFTRRHLDSGAWHITQVSDETLTRDLDITLDMWTQRWVAEKGRSAARRTTSIYRHMFETAHRHGMLHLPILWSGDTPLVAHACIADTSRGHVHFVAAGRSLENDQPNSGLLLHSESIRWAIDAGFRLYDFGHGDEAYKISLGGKNKRLQYLFVERRSLSPLDAIDTFNLSSAVRKIRSLIRHGKTREARSALAELSKIVEAHQLPDHDITHLSSKLEADPHG
ncbi:MAG: GNAT family N-acetyltransferase [Rhizobiaceae bacterium]|nr:GNAT family N-acetyltransferase [Hyphomicrobiales bacterium]NRB29931.1 GNAT family N-acetyltransferase [Rhizobiaceae bacterium]